jgi:4-amino-4-deoxy-L-arabinose transferase-like glycosyltransferase
MEFTRGLLRHLPALDRRFAAVFALGLGVRLGLLWLTRDLGTAIVDEQHYTQLARNIVAGNGFGWGPGDLTSMRPPLYPGFLAAVFGVAGPNAFIAVRALQIGLAAITALLVYHIGRLAAGERAGRIAAAIVWLYPTLLLFNFAILTETLFTCLLMLFVLLAVMLVREPRLSVALGCGLALGAATLTRSALWPLPIILCPLLAWRLQAPWRTRLILPAMVLAGYAIVVAPWAIRNTRLQQTFVVVDTMGGLNLRMGNYEHTPDDRMWDAVSLTGDRNWAHDLRMERPGQTFTEGQKEKWAQQKAIAYMREHPGQTVRRSLIKFADLWGLEREFVAGLGKGMYWVPRAVTVLVSATIASTYLFVALAGVAGLWLARIDRSTHLLLFLPLLAMTAAHTIVFGHSRYHLPLMPILAVYAATVIVHGVPVASARRLATAGAVATAVVLVAVWIRQVLFIDSSRLLEWIERG